MSRHIFIVLLLATDVALAAEPGAKHVTAAAQKKTAVVSGQTHQAQAKTTGAELQTEVVQPETQESQGQSETAEPQDPSEATAQSQADKDGKLTSVPGGKALGMSVLGNQEAP